MATHSYTFLPEQTQEDALHAIRLLAVEERPFQRVTRTLLGKDSLLKWTPPTQLPSPPPDSEMEEGTNTKATSEDLSKRQRFREDILLDFAALESSILRIQLIQSSNERERQRYAAEKAKILDTAQAVRDNTVELRTQLAEAQKMLELRKGYDELAAKLIDSTKLKPRADMREDIGKLEKEIEELEQEGADVEGLWGGRREAFERVVAEGQAMVRVVKGIKDEPEVEKDEVMEEGEDGEGETGLKGERSRIASPAPEGGRTPMPGTPLHASGDGEEGTPRPNNKLLDVEEGTRDSSRAGSPMLQIQSDDVEMSGEEHRYEDETALKPQPKTAAGMEVTSDQVATPVDGMEETEDHMEGAPEVEGADVQVETPAEVMDES